jgi:hypothetical protein
MLKLCSRLSLTLYSSCWLTWYLDSPLLRFFLERRGNLSLTCYERLLSRFQTLGRFQLIEEEAPPWRSLLLLVLRPLRPVPTSPRCPRQSRTRTRSRIMYMYQALCWLLHFLIQGHDPRILASLSEPTQCAFAKVLSTRVRPSTSCQSPTQTSTLHHA